MPEVIDAPIRRIQIVRNGRVEALIPRPPLRSSSTKANWHGVLFEEHRAYPEHVHSDLTSCSHVVHVVIGLPANHEWRVNGKVHCVRLLPGSILIVPHGLYGTARCSRSRPAMHWMVEFDPSLLTERIEESLGGNGVELRPQFGGSDPQLVRLIQTLHTDVVMGSPAGSLFGETVGAALSLHLAQQYSTRSQHAALLISGLAQRAVDRAIEYIRADLGRDLHLKELADIAGFSAFHFAKLFKRTTGCSPHQYVLQCRVDRAKELLRNPHMSLSEVSLRAGFADQSHLSNVFRRFVGTTPSRFRGL